MSGGIEWEYRAGECLWAGEASLRDDPPHPRHLLVWGQCCVLPHRPCLTRFSDPVGMLNLYPAVSRSHQLGIDLFLAEKDLGMLVNSEVNTSHCVPRWPRRQMAPGLYQQ